MTNSSPISYYFDVSNKKSFLFPVLIITTLAMGLYLNTLKNGFVFDDVSATIVSNPYIKSFDNLPLLFDKKTYFSRAGEISYRPVVTFTYFLDYAIYGSRAWGYHLTNILLHAFNGLLLYIFLALLIEPPVAGNQGPVDRHFIGLRSLSIRSSVNLPLIISLLFVTHPVLTEAVNAISFREDLLSYFFYMSTLILYVMIRSKSALKPRFFIFSLSCFTFSLALLSKEMALTLPLIVYCYDFLYHRKKRVWVIFNGYNTAYVVIALVYIFIRFYYFLSPIKAEVPGWEIFERLQTIPWLIMNYLKLTIFPISLSTDYVVVPAKSVLSPLFIGPFIGLLSLLFLIYVVRKIERGIVFGVILFIVTLIPVYNIIPITNPFAERYLYLPITGMLMAGGFVLYSTFEALPIKNLSFRMIIFLIIILYSVVVIERNVVWKEGYTLWYDTVRKMPNSNRAHYNLGYYYSRQGRVYEAIIEYKTALRLRPDHQMTALNLALMYFEAGFYPEALNIYEDIVRRFPNHQFAIGMIDEIKRRIK